MTLLAAILALGVLGAEAAWARSISLTTFGSAYTQDFNTLSNVKGSTTNNLTIPGWEIVERGSSVRDNQQYAVDDGGSNIGDTYSYGADGSTERALGELHTATLVPLVGASFTNHTGSTIARIDVAYTGEEWRLGTAGRPEQLEFQYSVDAGSLETGTWRGVPQLKFVTPDTTTSGAKNGDAAANRRTLAASISGLSIPPGATVWVRWEEQNAAGADDGLAVDDFSLTPHPSPAPPSITSPAGATFPVGQADGFTVTATGRPTPSLSQSGALPAGVTYKDNGNGTATLSGAPAAGTGGVYHLTITASNGVSPNTTQSFTLTVRPPPTVTLPAPPTVTVRTPQGGEVYARGQVIASDFGCSEGTDGPGLASCLDQRGRPSGAPLDTASPGAHTFTVIAVSTDGLSTAQTVSYTVRRRAAIRISAARPAPLERGCAVEIGLDERERTANTADATCRHLRLTLTGAISAGGKPAAATGTITVTYKVNLPLGHAAGRARAQVNHGRWRISLLLPGVNLDPVPPSYLIAVRYSGDHNLQPATTARRIRLESERAALRP